MLAAVLRSAVIVLCIPASVFAQTINADRDAAGTSASDQNRSPLEEIVVTARKRSENLRDVPESVVVASAAQLAAANVVSVADLTTVVPTLVVSTGTTNPFVTIRGFGSGNDLSFDQAVGKFVDNVSYGRDQDVRLPIFDAEQVEVLKGPQVLLYGNSTTAGAVTITSKKPGDTFEADGSVGYEYYAHEIQTQAGVTLPINGYASLRVAGIYDDLSKGWIYNTLTGENTPTSINDGGRVILRLTPTSALDIQLKAEYDRVHDSGFPVVVVAQPLVGPAFPLSSRDPISAYNNDVAPFFMSAYNILENETYQADVNLRALGGTITSTSAYRTMTYTGSSPSGAPVPTLNAWIDQAYQQSSEELRYAGSAGKLDSTFGVFFQHESLSVYEAIDTNLAALGAPLPPFAFNFNLSEKTDSYSGFADFTYHFTDQWSLEAGGRYSSIDRDADQAFFAGNIVPGKGYNQQTGGYSPNPAFDPLLMGVFGVPAHQYAGLTLHEDHFQPQVVVQYKVLDKDQIYAKYVEGYKAGGFDVNYEGLPGNVSAAGDQFLPEKATEYEVGFKGVAMGDRLGFSIDLFNEKFTDLQTNAFVGTQTVPTVTNVGQARSRGIESEESFAPVPQVHLSATIAYTDAIYQDFPGGACTREQTLLQPVGCQQDLSGTPTPFSSKWAGTLGADFQQTASNLIISEGALVLFRSAYNVSTNNDPILEQNAYAQFDAHLDLKPLSGPWSVSLYGLNLTDKHYLTAGDAIPLSTGALSAILARGRQVGVRVGFHF
jgi:iron complex outermembrane recepter protein